MSAIDKNQPNDPPPHNTLLFESTLEQKLQVDCLEDTTAVDSSRSGLQLDIESTKEYKTGRWKVDLCVTGTAMLLYFLAFLDKANLGNARVAGLATDLNLTSRQYSLLLTILYPPYILAELPANLLLKKIGAHILLPALTIAFGLVCCLQGLVQSFNGLLACRFFLGLAEGGVIPALVLWVSTWYKRSDFQVRAAWIFAFAAVAGAFAGLLAAAILNLDGSHGIRGWRWIFIIEGAMTIGCGMLVPLILRPNIESAWWLNPKEKRALRIAIAHSGRDKEDHGFFSWTEVFSAFQSPFAMLLLLPSFSVGVILFGFSYFLPTVVNSFGYSPKSTQLHTVPIYAVIFVCVLAMSWAADRYKFRGPQFICFGLISMLGYVLALVARVEQKNLRYAALFLQIFGGTGTSPGYVAWAVDNMAPYYKRGTVIALNFILTQCGGILSTWIYPNTQAPLFHVGASVSLGAAIIQVVVPGIIMFYLKKQNTRKARQLVELDGTSSIPDRPIRDTDPTFKYVI